MTIHDAPPAYRRAFRPADGRLLGGVAAGLAEHLGVPVVWVRAGFVVATWFHGAGVLAYLLLWWFLPVREKDLPPGLAAATRRGDRSAGTRGRPVREVVQTLALCAVGLGVLIILAHARGGVEPRYLAPILLAGAGVVVVWRQLDESSQDRTLWRDRGPAAILRTAVGLLLVVVAGVFLLNEGGLGSLLDVAAATLIALAGLGLVLGPWIARLSSDLASERRERVRTQERADVAAHLHDSVLQTLALLQKNASDPAAVATLARQQERELRSWLYGEQAEHGVSLAAGVRAAAAEVETAHHVRVDVITVGDAPADADVAALVRAAREAMVNAAKHAQVDRVDVYLEVTGKAAEVFVRDRGVGFDPEAVAADRMGLRGSIRGRMERHGGTADVRSAPGEGTEVRLCLPLHRSEEGDPS
ncbi:PspC domain-containing protein [Aeromicrobium sp. IC_218]|uniref:PspC domain-containing protein n=1 Tax=Aeromicrobium sp. IC_218 TaxID=2545468 RepID=UPI001F603886|nr:PspC domain-containing protein [Aeromicrobium sp. IC_218]